MFEKACAECILQRRRLCGGLIDQSAERLNLRYRGRRKFDPKKDGELAKDRMKSPSSPVVGVRTELRENCSEPLKQLLGSCRKRWAHRGRRPRRLRLSPWLRDYRMVTQVPTGTSAKRRR